MAALERSSQEASRREQDVVIIGGGIYGAMLLWEAARRGLRAVLVEKNDFGWSTSYNSLRIIHGGFRYLQYLNIRRLRVFANERRWFLKTFPGLVEPLPCILPLYNHGLKRPAVMRAALALNDLVTCDRNRDLIDGSRIPAGHVMDRDQAIAHCPWVSHDGLHGAAVWYDARMIAPSRIIIELLKQAVGKGAIALNYTAAEEIRTDARGVCGLLVRDRISGDEYTLQARRIINATGPWSPELAIRFGQPVNGLYEPSLAWNVLLDYPMPAGHAQAVTRARPGGQIFFLLPLNGRVLAGTAHTVWKGRVENPQPSRQQMEAFLSELSEAVPALPLKSTDVLTVYAGLLPAAGKGQSELALAEKFIDHGRMGGSAGFYSIAGVKFTTSRWVAEKVMNHIFGRPNARVDRGPVLEPAGVAHWSISTRINPENDDKEWLAEMEKIIAEEAVQYLDDLVFRRTSLGDNRELALKVMNDLRTLFPDDQAGWERTLDRLQAAVRGKDSTSQEGVSNCGNLHERGMA